ncbi:cytochrome P450, partial [Aureobasidium melanogenum]
MFDYIRLILFATSVPILVNIARRDPYSWPHIMLLAICLAILSSTCAIGTAMFIQPSFCSSLRNLPTATQKTIWTRLFKEPTSRDLARFHEQASASQLLRYFGVLNSERLLLTDPKDIKQVMDSEAYEFGRSYLIRHLLSPVLGKNSLVENGRLLVEDIITNSTGTDGQTLGPDNAIDVLKPAARIPRCIRNNIRFICTSGNGLGNYTSIASFLHTFSGQRYRLRRGNLRYVRHAISMTSTALYQDQCRYLNSRLIYIQLYRRTSAMIRSWTCVQPSSLRVTRQSLSPLRGLSTISPLDLLPCTRPDRCATVDIRSVAEYTGPSSCLQRDFAIFSFSCTHVQRSADRHATLWIQPSHTSRHDTRNLAMGDSKITNILAERRAYKRISKCLSYSVTQSLDLRHNALAIRQERRGEDAAFARDEMMILLAALVGRFDFSFHSSGRDHDPRPEELRISFDVVAEPVELMQRHVHRKVLPSSKICIASDQKIMTLCHVRNIGKHSLKKLDAQKRSTSKTSPSPSPSSGTCQMTSLQATNRLDLRVDRSVYKQW